MNQNEIIAISYKNKNAKLSQNRYFDFGNGRNYCYLTAIEKQQVDSLKFGASLKEIKQAFLAAATAQNGAVSLYFEDALRTKIDSHVVCSVEFIYRLGFPISEFRITAWSFETDGIVRV